MTRDFEKELNDLETALAAAPQQMASEYFGVQLMRDSLVRKREAIVNEAAGVLDLVLSSDDPRTTGDEISLVARVLEALQESLASIGQVLEGEPTSRGLIPSAIKDLVSLRIAATAPGSLQLKLVPAHPEIDMGQPQTSLLEAAETSQEGEDEEEAPLLDRSVDRLIGLLARAPGDTEELLQDLAYVGPRTTSHIQDLTKALNEADANVSLAWNSAHCCSEATFSRSASRALGETLDAVKEDSREVVATGRLVGGSLVHRTFELEPAGEEQSLIAGKVAEDALPSLELLFGQTCTAHMEVREARLPSGETREAHFLTALST
jgi:hypothetical protein